MSLGAEAMALASLNRFQEARRRLRQAGETLETTLPHWASRIPNPGFDYDFAYAIRLLREAEAVVLWDSIFPSNPFATPP
jgi:hypothetical protein